MGVNEIEEEKMLREIEGKRTSERVTIMLCIYHGKRSAALAISFSISAYGHELQYLYYNRRK